MAKGRHQANPQHQHDQTVEPNSQQQQQHDAPPRLPITTHQQQITTDEPEPAPAAQATPRGVEHP